MYVHSCIILEFDCLQVFDAFTPRLSDPNVKVNLHALEAFSNMIPLLGNHLSSVVWSVLSTLPINSKLPGIAPAAGVVLDLMCEHIELTHLVQPLTNLAEFTNSKAQTIFITKINGMCLLQCIIIGHWFQYELYNIHSFRAPPTPVSDHTHSCPAVCPPPGMAPPGEEVLHQPGPDPRHQVPLPGTLPSYGEDPVG